MRRLIATAANAAWSASAWPDYRRFVQALANPRAAQEQSLRDYLHHNADTDIGRRYGFADIHTVAAFQRRIPIQTYDAMASDMDRIAAGEQNVLTADPVVRLVPSSGSTRARKLIPYTAGLQREFNRAIGPWIIDLYRNDPSLSRGCAYWSITPIQKNGAPHTKNAPPIGFDQDSAYLGGVRGRLIDAVMAVPNSVRHITEIEAFRTETLRHLLRRRDLRLISVWHPSFLELLLDAGEPRDWRKMWPNLRLVSCWADAHAAAPAAALAKRLPHVRMQSKGLLATEAFVSIPFANAHPLAVRSHFFEFLDESGTARLADELRIGGIYSVVVTTGGGLWRYRLGDLIEVDGFVSRTPSIRFIGREDHIVDRFGEKLSDGFAANAIAATLEACGVMASFSMLAPDESGGATRYTLFVQSSDPLPAQLAQCLDQRLCANPHYDYCRSLGQLHAPAIFQIRDGAFNTYTGVGQRAGMRLGDIKPIALSPSMQWATIFDGAYVSGGA